MQQSQIVDQKNDSVGFYWHISFVRDMSMTLEKNALTADGCCWYAQHGLCHRTRLMLCPPTHGTRCAVYRRLCHVLINFSCTVTSAGVAALAESNFARLRQCCRITWRSGGRVVFHRRSRLLIFAHDTYSGTNGHLAPFVGVDSNAISNNGRHAS